MDDHNGHFERKHFQFHIQILSGCSIIQINWTCFNVGWSCLQCAVKCIVNLLLVEFSCCHISACKLYNYPSYRDKGHVVVLNSLSKGYYSYSYDYSCLGDKWVGIVGGNVWLIPLLETTLTCHLVMCAGLQSFLKFCFVVVRTFWLWLVPVLSLEGKWVTILLKRQRKWAKA